ncbi:MAG TPA: hypothetical protein VGR51_05870, partial [Thermoplasmata archaeon]|nr:hypothetical protein [Thermoplasmata archaeon]
MFRNNRYLIWFRFRTSGNFLAAGVSLAFGVFELFLFNLFPIGTELGLEYLLIFAIVLSTSLLIQLLVCCSSLRIHDSRIGGTAFGIGVVSVTVFLLGSAALLLTRRTVCDALTGCITTVAPAALIAYFIGIVLLGVMFILEGVIYVTHRRETGNPEAALIGGVLFVFGGGLICTVFLAIFGGFFVVASGMIVEGVVMSKTRSPPFREPH